MTRSLWILVLLLTACGGAVSESSSGIVFGTGIGDDLALQGERDTFAPDDHLYFVAQLGEPAGTRSLTVNLARREGASEQVVLEEPFAIADPEFDVIGTDLDLAVAGFESGDYVMRVFRDEEELAEGEFTIR